MKKVQGGKKIFRVTALEMAKNRMPLNSIAVAHLFYGVPTRMTKWRQEVGSWDLIFYE